jgi:hypothetical protein
MIGLQIFGALSALAYCLYWCFVVRAARRAGPGWTWGFLGSPFRFDRNETIVLAGANVIASVVFAIGVWLLFA